MKYNEVLRYGWRNICYKSRLSGQKLLHMNLYYNSVGTGMTQSV